LKKYIKVFDLGRLGGGGGAGQVEVDQAGPHAADGPGYGVPENWTRPW